MQSLLPRRLFKDEFLSMRLGPEETVPTNIEISYDVLGDPL
jgi:hypothetical protein